MQESNVRRQVSSVKDGFSLVELIIYIGIFSVVSIFLTMTLISTLRVQTSEVKSNEVSRELNLVLETIQRETTKASLIEEVYEGTNRGTTCTVFCSVRLRTKDIASDPTVIKSDSGGVYISRGKFAPVSADFNSITTNKVTVTNLIFAKLGNPGGRAILQIDLSISHNSPNSQPRVARSAVGRASAATFDSNVFPNSDGGFDLGQAGNRWKDAFFSGSIGIGTTSPGAKLEIQMPSTNSSQTLRIRKDATSRVDLFMAVGDTTSRDGDALCQNGPLNSACLAHWNSTGAKSTCATTLTLSKALCAQSGL